MFTYRGGEPLEAVAPELLAQIPLDSDRLWISRLRGELAWSTYLSATGDATHPGVVAISNPNPSGIVTMIEGLVISNINATQESTQILFNAFIAGSPPTGTGGIVRNRDNRVKGSPTTIAGATTNAATPGVLLGQIVLAAGTTIYVPVELVMGEGNEVIIAVGANTKAVSVWAWGRERGLEPGEKAPL